MRELTGIGVSSGIAIGRAHLLAPSELDVSHFHIERKDVLHEVARLNNAFSRVRAELDALRAGVAADAPGEVRAFLDLHRLILDDALLCDAPRDLVRGRLINAEWALALQLEEVCKQFEAIDDDYFRGRSQDVRQVVERVLKMLTGGEAGTMPAVRRPADGERLVLVARDLAPLGYEVTVFEGEAKAGGFIRTQIPRFRLPESVIDEETGYILDMGVIFKSGQRIESMKGLLDQGYDAVFVGCGAPRGRDLNLPGRSEIKENIHIGIDWLASVSFGHITSIGKRVIVLGGGNTAMDCCRSARRLGGTDVKVIVRSGFDEMKASPWEKEDAQHEGIPIINFHVPKSFEHSQGKLTGMYFEVVKAVYDSKGKRSLVPTGEPDVLVECDAVLIAVGQENAFPWIERDCGINFDEWGLPVLNKETFQSSLPNVFFGGDSAFGPKNIITAVAHGHEAAVSIDRLLNGEDVARRPDPMTNLMSTKMGIHEWSYDNDTSNAPRFKVPWAKAEIALASIRVEVELGFDAATAFKEAGRCLAGLH